MHHDTRRQEFSDDGKFRLSIYREEYPDSPLNMWDMPLHCYDWDRHYCLVDNKSRQYDFKDARTCLQQLLCWYGDYKKIIDHLVANAKSTFHDEYDCALIYKRPENQWHVMMWQNKWTNHKGEAIEAHWEDLWAYDCKKDELDVYSILEDVSDECISDLAQICLTDKVKVMCYNFGYYGEINFYESYSCNSEGIAYLVKEECVGERKWFTEEEWNLKTIKQLTEGLIKEIEDYSEGNVFWCKLEKYVSWNVHRECTSEEREPQDFRQEEWEEYNSGGGFYGDTNYIVDYISDTYNINFKQS